MAVRLAVRTGRSGVTGCYTADRATTAAWPDEEGWGPTQLHNILIETAAPAPWEGGGCVVVHRIRAWEGTLGAEVVSATDERSRFVQSPLAQKTPVGCSVAGGNGEERCKPRRRVRSAVNDARRNLR